MKYSDIIIQKSKLLLYNINENPDCVTFSQKTWGRRYNYFILLCELCLTSTRVNFKIGTWNFLVCHFPCTVQCSYILYTICTSHFITSFTNIADYSSNVVNNVLWRGDNPAPLPWKQMYDFKIAVIILAKNYLKQNSLSTCIWQYAITFMSYCTSNTVRTQHMKATEYARLGFIKVSRTRHDFFCTAEYRTYIRQTA